MDKNYSLMSSSFNEPRVVSVNFGFLHYERRPINLSLEIKYSYSMITILTCTTHNVEL